MVWLWLSQEAQFVVLKIANMLHHKIAMLISVYFVKVALCLFVLRFSKDVVNNVAQCTILKLK